MSDLIINSTDNNEEMTKDEDQNSSTYRYRIQVGLFRIYDNAQNLQMQLNQLGLMPEIVRQGDLYAVHVGDFCNMDDAVMLEQMIRRLGYNTLLVAV